MLKIKIIDLVNQIARHDSDLPKQIKYNDKIYNLYIDDNFINYEPECGDWLFNQYLYKLNDEIEIIEEKKIELPEKFELKDFEGLSCIELHETFNNKINELIDYLKYKEEESKK